MQPLGLLARLTLRLTKYVWRSLPLSGSIILDVSLFILFCVFVKILADEQEASERDVRDEVDEAFDQMLLELADLEAKEEELQRQVAELHSPLGSSKLHLELRSKDS
ncbi:hypothetical protein BV22DRAFT_1047074 [Leucogyrophana mollusca]|uniref:Uncharacterized protein n=1 Tax=Leucogyrophana mollusca TaxID=85980 RepID=A0ACB8BI16_9AGAM|nr:hypothetical protein BV22DRAFT_1047074 [Leucogyrophana mollusca]